MIYLVRSYKSRNRSTLGLGYIEDGINITDLINNLRILNPGIELIGVRGGDGNIFKKLDIYFRYLGYSCENYWYFDNLDILELFHISILKLDREIRRYRLKERVNIVRNSYDWG